MSRGAVVVCGPEGHFGRAVVAALAKSTKDPVVVLTPNPSAVHEEFPAAALALRFNGMTGGPWMEVIDGARAVVNLTAALPSPEPHPISHDQRRWMAARTVVEAIDSVRQRPEVLIGCGSVRVLGAASLRAGASPLDETALVPPLEELRTVRAAENVTLSARSQGLRVVLLRLGVVLDAREGLLPPYVSRFMSHLGGPLLPPSARWPWIHVEDAVGLIRFALETSALQGPVNAVAPTTATSMEVASQVGARTGHLPWLPLPAFAARRILGADAVAPISGGPPVIPARVQTLGYTFRHPVLESALGQILPALAPAPQQDEGQYATRGT